MAVTTFNEHTMPYDALVFIEGDSVIAIDRDGDKIATGTAGTDDRTVIVAALTSLAATGGTVRLAPGVFTITSSFGMVRNYTTLEGSGTESTVLNFTTSGAVRIEGHSYCTLRDFKITGSGTVQFYTSHNKIHNITSVVDNLPGAAFYLIALTGTTAEDNEFVNCKALDCGTYGFLNTCTGTGIIKNLRHINCQAINCGAVTRVNDWVVGFDVIEAGILQDVSYVNCLAEGCWESGFHTESTPTKTRVSFINCTSRNNGNTKVGALYASGFYFPNSTTTDVNVSMVGCIAQENKKYGYSLGKGMSARDCIASGNTSYGFSLSNSTVLVGCTDYASGHGFGVGDSDYVFMSGCSSYSCLSQALSVSISHDTTILDFHAYNPAGSGTSQINLGYSSGYAYNNYFDLHVVDETGTSDIVISVTNVQNSIITGSISTVAEYPIRIDNDCTGLTIRDLDINCTGSTAGRGIYLYSTSRNVDKINIRNCVIRDTASPSTLGYGIFNGTTQYKNPEIYNCEVIGATTKFSSTCPDNDKYILRNNIAFVLETMGTAKLLCPFIETSGTSISDYSRNANTLTSATDVGLRIPTTSTNVVDSSADTTHFVDASLTGSDDYVNGYAFYNKKRFGHATITDFDSATDAVTIGTAITGLATGDTYYIDGSWNRIRGNTSYLNFLGDSRHYLSRVDDADFTFGNGTTDSAFSIIVAVSPGNVTSRTIVCKWTETAASPLREWRLFFDANGYPTFQLYDESADAYIGRQDQTAFSTSLDAWKIIVATYDGSATSAGCKIYIDGAQLDDANSAAGSYVAMEDTASLLYVGCKMGAAAVDEFFSGKMSWLGITAKELSADEVWSLTQRLKGLVGI